MVQTVNKIIRIDLLIERSPKLLKMSNYKRNTGG